LCGHGPSTNVVHPPLGSRLEEDIERPLCSAPKALEFPLHYHL
jgi:hypothetical protein